MSYTVDGVYGMPTLISYLEMTMSHIDGQIRGSLEQINAGVWHDDKVASSELDLSHKVAEEG